MAYKTGLRLVPRCGDSGLRITAAKQAMATSFCCTPWVLGRAARALGLPRHRHDPHLQPWHVVSLSHRSPFNTLRLPPLASPFHQSASRACQHAQAVNGRADELHKGVVDKDIVSEVKRILEMANRASSRKIVLHTDFLTPPVLKESLHLLEKLVDVRAIPQGGYPQAERCRISVGHVETLTSEPDIVAALSITGSFSFESYSHGDFLGAILGTGIAREKLGDIILQGAKGAQILIVPELVDYVMSTLDRIGSVRVSCTKVPLDAIEYDPPRTQSFKSVEASLRVDALASAGFKISRTKLTALISNGDVRVNWATVTKNGTTLKSGDIVSISGKGRLKIGEVNPTKKGKFSVELIRYL
ncbi:hypothetical protein SAY87_002975 [Trapa incisa]|uniref:RNA-binding S4 domain-containing protein n=1 Tax=Trapa incisa TaxID=236973 RepID=A0AAN7KMJ3_9MYRT|nr:hypothetical protein SAY87_002975 [Trapa incisa]